MKVNELMIGDKVQQRGCTTPSVVAGLTSGKIHTIWADGSKHSKDAYYFDPIPLTTEILEKNGFEYNTYNRLMNGRYGVALTETDGHFFIWARIQLDYVHELQRALRLCGLNELADNLKV